MNKELPDYPQKVNIISHRLLKLPEYDEDFGNLAEKIIRESISKKSDIIVEKVEKGTDAEDKRRKVDFWLKFKGLEQPIGTQYTVSDNEDKIKEKKDF